MFILDVFFSSSQKRTPSTERACLVHSYAAWEWVFSAQFNTIDPWLMVIHFLFFSFFRMKKNCFRVLSQWVPNNFCTDFNKVGVYFIIVSPANQRSKNNCKISWSTIALVGCRSKSFAYMIINLVTFSFLNYFL